MNYKADCRDLRERLVQQRKNRSPSRESYMRSPSRRSVLRDKSRTRSPKRDVFRRTSPGGDSRRERSTTKFSVNGTSRSGHRSRSRSGTKKMRSRSRSGTRMKRSRSRSRTKFRNRSRSRRSRSGTRRRSKSRTKRRSRSGTRKSRKISPSPPPPPPRPLSSTSNKSFGPVPSTSTKNRDRDKKSKISPEKSKASSRNTSTNSSSNSMVVVKTEPGTKASPALLSLPGPDAYFKPIPPVDLNPILGFSKCPVCQSYFEDDDVNRNKHLSYHPDRVFVITLPSDTMVTDIEDAIRHLATLGIKKEELKDKITQNQLVKYPNNLQGFSCAICRKFNGDEKSALLHIKEVCKVSDKDARQSKLVFFCRGCNQRFNSTASLQAHVSLGKNSCFPSSMVLNRIYDSLSTTVLSNVQKEKEKQEANIKIKQERIQEAQIEIKRERMSGLDSDCPPPPQICLPTSQQGNNYDMLPSVNSHTTQELKEMLVRARAPVQNNLNPAIDPFSPSQFNPNPALSPFPQYNTAAAAAPFHLLNPSVSPFNQLNPVAPPFHQLNPVMSPTIPNHQFINVSNTLPISQPIYNNYSPPPPQYSPPSPQYSPSPPPVKQEILETSTFPMQRKAGSRGLKVQHSVPQQKLASREDCIKSLCEWGASHIDSCSKSKVILKCSKKECTWGDMHRMDYTVQKDQSNRKIVTHMCPNWNFHCNMKKTSPDDYELLDKWTPTIKEACRGERNLSVKEERSIPMRLLSTRVNKTMQDPRKEKANYPSRTQVFGPFSFRGSSKRIPSQFQGESMNPIPAQEEWDRRWIISTYSVPRSERCFVIRNNPHVEKEDEDEIECFGEVQGTGEPREIVIEDN